MEKFAILFREEIDEYDFGKGHPFHQRRGKDFLNFLKEKIQLEFPIIKADKITTEDLLLICNLDYIEFTKNYFNSLQKNFDFKFYQYHSTDNLPRAGSGKIEEAARYIVGQAKLAADLVFERKYQKVISIGGGLHHAKRNFGEGFCLYNDVAFCAKYLIKKYNLKRILILDTDAHAGNGTLEYFYEDERVLFVDIHQDPNTIYPQQGFIEEIGKGRGEGFSVNIPLPPLAGNQCYKLAFEEIIEPLAKEFKPEIIIRNGGSDPHFSDPLTNLNLTLKGFYMIGSKVNNLSKICQGREIDMIASGYNLKTLHYCWLALIAGLLGIKIKLQKEKAPEEKESVIRETKEIMQRLKKILSRYWQVFK
jgi:acetoin utilization protein AcuC